MNFAKDKKEDIAILNFLGGVTSTLSVYSENNFRDYEREKIKVINDLREKLACDAAQRIGHELQAPSFRHSMWSEAGGREGKIIGNINDYTRDRHPLANELENSLVKEYQPKGVEAFVTLSGMAALTTIRLALKRMGVTGKTLVGGESYFQNREQLVGEEVIVFNELDLDALGEIIVKEKVGVVMVDTVSNTEKLLVADIKGIARVISAKAKSRAILVIDNSMLGPNVVYKDLWKLRSKNLEIIIWESLNKYFQYGMDRTTGGVVFAKGDMASQIFYARMHAGTIMPDVACAMMPKQSLKYVHLYQKRMERNKNVLKEYLPNAISAERVGYSGVQLVVPLTKANPIKLNFVIWRCIREATRRGVQLSAGSSFGLPNTRIYLTARKTTFARMFLRISVGWESECAIREIGEVLKKIVG